MANKIVNYFKSFYTDLKKLFAPLSKNPQDYINFAKKYWILILSILLIVGVASKNNTNTTSTDDNIKTEASQFGDIGGTYSGTSQMGYSTGTASIEIDLDGSAVLTYDQGSYGGATEYGYIEKVGYMAYKFHSTSGGGTYDLRKTIYGVVLEGSNWRCEMNKK